jgi:AraC family transcriptional regulator of adaptative response/methylated-DNA-[protein]-cysteine methyltransferase
MTTMTERPKTDASPATDDDRWKAVLRRDSGADGQFVFAVKTTGVYCRPSCGARRARRENVQFYRTPADAERAGFRACKRCRPDDAEFDRGHADAVAKACATIVKADEPPDLEALATAAGVSPSQFHRIFKSMTGLTPKAYAIAQRARRVREALSKCDSVTSAFHNAGFRSSGRFYAKSTQFLGMLPATFRAGGAGATIRFAVARCSLGSVLVAASQHGVCSVALGGDADALVRELRDRFPKATLLGGDEAFGDVTAKVVALVERPAAGLNLPLDVQGTAFQHRVWRKLREIACGQTWTYSELAEALGEPHSARAVARACAANPVAVAIPCHRIVGTDGSLSGYRWGVDRKAKLLRAERETKANFDQQGKG